MLGRPRADHEQKQDFGDRTVTQGLDTQWPITEDFGDRTVTQGLDTQWPITEALLWHSRHRTQSEASPADWTSQAQGVGQMVKQPAPDGWQGRLWRRPDSFFPPWRRASVDAAGTSRRSVSAGHAGADRAMNGPRSDRARVLP